MITVNSAGNTSNIHGSRVHLRGFPIANLFRSLPLTEHWRTAQLSNTSNVFQSRSTIPPSSTTPLAQQSTPPRDLPTNACSPYVVYRPFPMAFKKPSLYGTLSSSSPLTKRGKPYLGAFLLNDEIMDSDVITNVNSVHSVSMFL